jgi:hypothetical protein
LLQLLLLGTDHLQETILYGSETVHGHSVDKHTT